MAAMFSDEDLGLSGAAAPAATPAAGSGMLSDADLGLAGDAAKPHQWSGFAEQGVRGIPSEIARTAGEHWHSIREGFAPAEGKGAQGPIEGTLATGKALLAIPQLAMSPVTGAARSLLGRPLAAAVHGAGTLIAPEIAAKDDPEALYRESAGNVETAIGAVMPKGYAGVPRAAAPGSPVVPETPGMPGAAPAVARETPAPGQAPDPVPGPAAPTVAEAIPVQVERENLGIRLLPADSPHIVPAAPPAAPAMTAGAPLGGRRSVGAAATPEVGPLSEVSPATLQKMKEVLKEEGFTAHTLEQRLEEMSAHEFLGELSPTMRLHMSALQGSPGPGRNEIVNSVVQRGREAAERMTAAFNRAFGPRENRAEMGRLIQLTRDQQTEPFWNTFKSTPIPPSPELNALMPRLEAAGALRASNKNLAVEGLPAENGFLRLGRSGGREPDEFLYLDPRITTGSEVGNVSQVPTATAFQFAKEHLDDLIEKAMSAPGGENDARRYTALKNALVGAIDNHPDARVRNIWREARDSYATPTSVLKAMKMGERALTGNIHADELPFLTASFSPAELKAFNIGVRGRLEDIAGRPGKTENAVINTVLAPANQSKIRWSVGDIKADELIAAIEHEQRMHHAPNQLIYNSMTQPRIEAAKVWTPQPGFFKDVSLGDVVSHPVKTVGKLAAKAGMSKMADRQSGKFETLRNEASRLFTLQGADRDATLRRIVEMLAAEEGHARGGRVSRNTGGRATEESITAEFARRAAADRQRNAVSKTPLRAAGGRVNGRNIEADPTEAQKKAGNYAKDHVKIHGLDITIENAKGATRSGVDRGGKPWSVTMPAHYGYIKGTVGKDKDHVDVYVGPHVRAPKVFVIDQKNAETGQFDEHKSFIGFATREQVMRTYRKAFSDGRADERCGSIHDMSVGAFKHWLDDGDTTKPMLAEAEKKKLAHAAVGYVATSKVRNEACATCSMFIAADHGGPACTLVKGPIDAAGWCRRFDAKGRA